MSTASELLQQLRSIGVQLALDGETLKLNAPKGALTVELQAQLREAKPQILELLREMRGHGGLAGAAPIARVERRPRMPLSLAQQRLWFLYKMDPTSAAYSMLFLLRMDGTLDVEALEQALAAIVRRHESLRTIFAESEGEPSTVIGDGSGWTLERRAQEPRVGESREDASVRFAHGIFAEPFDLETGPLFRACLLQVSEQEHVLGLYIHHAISDGWSIGVLVREMMDNYSTLLAGDPLPARELAVQYADYAAWQREWLASGVLDKQMRYWRKQLDGAPAIAMFPPDHRRRMDGIARGRRIKRVFSPEFARAVDAFSRVHGVTPFMTMLAAFLVLMARYSGQRDLVVGSPSANRSRSELGELIGLFINNLVLRVQVDEGLSFLDLLKRVRETTLGGFEHPDAPFDLLVRELASDRNTDNAPLFQTMFSMQNFPLDALKLPRLTVTPMETVAAAARFDLSAEVYPYDGELRVYFEYNAELYDEATMWELLDGFERVLREVMAAPETAVDAVPVLSQEARAERLACGNDTELDVAACPMVHEALERFARLTPEKIAVYAGDEALSYAELNARANALAARLRVAGVGPGALVPVCLKRSVDLPVALFAVLKTGAAYVPLDPIYPRQRIAGILGDVAPGIVITESELLPLVKGFAAELLVLDEFALDSLGLEADSVVEAAKSEAVSREALAYVIFTSGSTGKPKGVEITHGALVNFLEAMRRTPGFTNEDRILAVTTVSFDIAGLELFLPIYAGGEVAIAQAPGDLPALLADLDRYKPTVMQATPALWQMLVSAGWDGDAALTMLCGGEALTPQLAAELVTRGKALWNMYGPTETTIWSSALRIDRVDEASVAVGGPIANTTFYVLDGRREPVPAGVAGELYIGGSGVARGYFRRPELTAERFIPSPFKSDERLYRTGDLVRQRRDGTLVFLGRADFQVKLRGFRIELGEIEFAFRQQPEVAECVVLLREDEGQKELVAYLVPKPGQTVVYDELRARLRERLPEYMTPGAAVILDAFPRLPNGKLDRSQLPAPQALRAPPAKASQSEAASETEAVILRVFRGLLQSERIGLHQRFFDLGAHSLMLVKAHDALRRELYPELRLVSFFQYPSVAALALHIDQSRGRNLEQSRERNLVRSGSVSGELAHAAKS